MPVSPCLRVCARVVASKRLRCSCPGPLWRPLDARRPRSASSSAPAAAWRTGAARRRGLPASLGSGARLVGRLGHLGRVGALAPGQCPGRGGRRAQPAATALRLPLPTLTLAARCPDAGSTTDLACMPAPFQPTRPPFCSVCSWPIAARLLAAPAPAARCPAASLRCTTALPAFLTHGSDTSIHTQQCLCAVTRASSELRQSGRGRPGNGATSAAPAGARLCPPLCAHSSSPAAAALLDPGKQEGRMGRAQGGRCVADAQGSEGRSAPGVRAPKAAGAWHMCPLACSALQDRRLPCICTESHLSSFGGEEGEC